MPTRKEDAGSPAVLEWLLEPGNPSVRFLALRDLLGKRRDDSEVIEARAAIMEGDPVRRILARQSDGGHWGRPEDFYVRSKYKGTIWNLLLLAELNASGEDERVRRACQFVLQNSQTESGGFSVRKAEEESPGRHSVVPCYTGNMTFAMIRFGFLDDERVQRAIGFLTRYRRFDDGDGRPKGFPYQHHENCWGRHTCMLGVVKTLKALAEVPPGRRKGEVKRTIEESAEFLPLHHLYKSSHDPDQVGQNRWPRFGFPLMWDTDVLEMLLLLARLGYKDERLDDAIGLVRDKQKSNGRWRAERSWNGRMLVRIDKEDESKWITLRALTALRTIGR